MGMLGNVVVEETWLIGLHGFYRWDWKCPDLEPHLPPFCPVAQSPSNFFASHGPKAPGCAPTPSRPRQPHHSAQGSVGTYLHPCCNVILSASDTSLSGFGRTLIEIVSRTSAHLSTLLRARRRPAGRARQGKQRGAWNRSAGAGLVQSSRVAICIGRRAGGRASSESIKV